MNDFNNISVLRMLFTIHYQTSISGLLDLGLEYSQISKLISYFLENGLVEESKEEELVLTKQGLELLESLKKQTYPGNSSAWILPSEENRIPKINKFDIYLPRKKKNVQ